MIKQRPEITEQDLAVRIANIIQSYPNWLATEYPTKIRVTRRHAVWGVTLQLSTDRTFDIKVKERK